MKKLTNHINKFRYIKNSIKNGNMLTIEHTETKYFKELSGKVDDVWKNIIRQHKDFVVSIDIFISEIDSMLPDNHGYYGSKAIETFTSSFNNCKDRSNPEELVLNENAREILKQFCKDMNIEIQEKNQLSTIAKKLK